jgi:hypothetical protein
MHTDIRAAFGFSRGRRTVSSGASFPRPVFGTPPCGYAIFMTDDRTERRAADLLPEERTVGSADPEAQAEAILADSDEREHDPGAAPDSFLERRDSGQTVTPEEGTR